METLWGMVLAERIIGRRVLRRLLLDWQRFDEVNLGGCLRRIYALEGAYINTGLRPAILGGKLSQTASLPFGGGDRSSGGRVGKGGSSRSAAGTANAVNSRSAVGAALEADTHTTKRYTYFWLFVHGVFLFFLAVGFWMDCGAPADGTLAKKLTGVCFYVRL